MSILYLFALLYFIENQVFLIFAQCNISILQKSVLSILAESYDSELMMTAPGPTNSIAFQHVLSTSALVSAQAIAHNNFPEAANQFRQLMKSQWNNGMLPNLIYGSSVKPSTEWIQEGKNFLPGPGFWKIPRELQGESPFLTSGVCAIPLHAETALRILMLAPLDTSIGIRVYSSEALKFLYDIFPSLMRWHRYLFSTRNLGIHSDTLVSIRHPWEASEFPFPVFDSVLYQITKEEDYDQVVKNIKPSQEEQKAFKAQYHGLGGTNIINDTYFPMLYLINCFAKNAYNEEAMAANCPFSVANVGFNSILLRSTISLSTMAVILLEDGINLIGKDSETIRLDYLQLERWIKRLGDALKLSDKEGGLWNTRTKFYYDKATYKKRHLFSESLTLQMSMGFLPMYSEELPDITNSKLPSRISLMEKFFSPSDGIRFSCDYFPVSLYRCSSNGHDTLPRLVFPFYNYLLKQAFLKNHFQGIAGFLRNKTLELVCNSLSEENIIFSDIYDANTGIPLLSLSENSSLSASSLLNILLPPYIPLPNPDTPPINHTVTLVVMCVELFIAFAVGIGCVVFSVYFIATRPPETTVEQSNTLSPDTSTENTNSLKNSERKKYQYTKSEEALAESLLAEEEQEYQTFNVAGTDNSEPLGYLAETWISVNDFFKSISPWTGTMR